MQKTTLSNHKLLSRREAGINQSSHRVDNRTFFPEPDGMLQASKPHRLQPLWISSKLL